MYAEDVKLYYSFSNKDVHTANILINRDIHTFLYWAKIHSMSVNASKSQLIIFPGTKITIPQNSIKVYINNDPLTPVSCIKNLGLRMDNALKFKEHINHLIKMLIIP